MLKTRSKISMTMKMPDSRKVRILEFTKDLLICLHYLYSTPYGSYQYFLQGKGELNLTIKTDISDNVLQKAMYGMKNTDIANMWVLTQQSKL